MMMMGALAVGVWGTDRWRVGGGGGDRDSVSTSQAMAWTKYDTQPRESQQTAQQQHLLALIKLQRLQP